jgi:DNA-binding transcriptional LysR family regulator
MVQVDGHQLTQRQAEAVLALYLKGTQRAAARSLGISAPVLNRHLRQVESKLALPIMDCGPRGTTLNQLGEGIAKEQMALQGRSKERERPAVACTPLSEDMMMQALNTVDPKGESDVVISEDRRNVADFKAGMLDLIILDDPLYAYESEGGSWAEVGSDRLLHVRRGTEYALYRFGAQRLGYRYLESIGEEHRIVRTYSSLTSLMRSNYSYFISEALVAKKGQRPRSDTDPSLLPYSILCLHRDGMPFVDGMLKALRPADRIV